MNGHLLQLQELNPCDQIDQSDILYPTTTIVDVEANWMNLPENVEQSLNDIVQNKTNSIEKYKCAVEFIANYLSEL